MSHFGRSSKRVNVLLRPTFPKLLMSRRYAGKLFGELILKVLTSMSSLAVTKTDTTRENWISCFTNDIVNRIIN